MRKIHFQLLLIAVITLLVIGFIAGHFWWNFKSQEVSNSISDWGSFGDYFGSLVGAVFGFSTFLLLLWNIRLTVRQLEKSNNQFLLNRNHEEILLLYGLVKETESEIEAALSESDKIGEFTNNDPFSPTDFPLERLRDKRIIVTDDYSKTEGYQLPGVQLLPALEVFESHCKLMYPLRQQMDDPPLTWIDYFKVTNSPFYRLLSRLIRLNSLLQRIKDLNPDSTLMDIYKGRFSSVVFVLAFYKYLKLDEECRFLITELDYELVESYLCGFFSPKPLSLSDINKEIDQMRGKDLFGN